MIAGTRNLILYFWLDFWSWYVAAGGKVIETSTKKRLLSMTVFWTIVSTHWQAIYCIADIAIRTASVKEVKRANVMEFEAEI